MSRAEVVIVGGGFAGLTTAAALSGTGRRIVLLETRKSADPRFRGELLHPRGVEILAGLGLLEPLCRIGASAGGFSLQLDPGRDPVLLPYGELPSGLRAGLVIHHPELLDCLREAISRRGDIELRQGERAVALLRDGERITGVRTAGGEELRAGLTVIAEGRHSGLRGQLGVRERKELLSFTAVVRVEKASLPRPGYGHVLLGRWGPVLAYELRDGSVRLCVDLPVEMVQGKQDVAEQLRRESVPLIPEPLREGVLEALRTQRVEVCANHELVTFGCAAPGVAGVGDAAGCLHPLTAAGLTTAAHDVQVLAEELSAGGDPDAALERYQTRRYRFSRARMLLTAALYELLRSEHEGALVIRQGLWQHLHADARSRGRALAILSGHDSRFSAFLGEYVQVLTRSLRHANAGGVSVPGLQRRTRATYGVLGMLMANVRRTAWAAYYTARG